jgi:hypothetical protein
MNDYRLTPNIDASTAVPAFGCLPIDSNRQIRHTLIQ